MARPKNPKAAGQGSPNGPAAGSFAASQPICVSDIYPVAEFRRRAGLTEAAMRAARRRGLPVLRTGKRAYVSGQDFLDFLRAENGPS